MARNYSTNYGTFLTVAERQEIMRIKALHAKATKASNPVKKTSKKMIESFSGTGALLAVGCFSALSH